MTLSIPRKVQREAYRILRDILQERATSKDEITWLWAKCGDQAVAEEAWTRACKSLIAIAERRGDEA